jgi:cytochrome c oxidase subunit 1
MMRRIADPTMYEHLRNLQPINQFITISAFAMGLTQLIFIYNFFKSMKSGKPAGNNPWKSNTLEWTVPSPPVHGNFGAKIPVVHHGPYEYSLPGHTEDYLPQDQALPNNESAGEFAKRHGYVGH